MHTFEERVPFLPQRKKKKISLIGKNLYVLFYNKIFTMRIILRLWIQILITTFFMATLTFVLTLGIQQHTNIYTSKKEHFWVQFQKCLITDASAQRRKEKLFYFFSNLGMCPEEQKLVTKLVKGPECVLWGQTKDTGFG